MNQKLQCLSYFLSFWLIQIDDEMPPARATDKTQRLFHLATHHSGAFQILWSREHVR